MLIYGPILYISYHVGQNCAQQPFPPTPVKLYIAPITANIL